jgi:S-adenosylmethionine-diacylglycerol 3-amino-3-carboxypropyl transferase
MTAMTPLSILPALRDGLFRAFQQHHLIYNACFEDPVVDRAALGLGASDRVLVITSGGCNALDYLLAGAGAVEAVDSNPCQSALLEFKAAGIRSLPHSDFWELFGLGRSARAGAMYRDAIRRQLSLPARRFWDRHIHYFAGRGCRASFYHHGGWGVMMWIIVGYWKHVRGLRGPIEALFQAGDLAEQKRIYESHLRGKLWTPGMSWLCSRRLPLVVMGIPERQREAMLHYPGGMHRRGEIILEELMAMPMWSNPFMRVYIMGSYSPEHCPEYLTPDGFARLKEGLLERLTIRTATLTEHLRKPGPPFTRFVLLDHMDWLGPEDLTDEWQAILGRAAPGARALCRSALPHVDYLYPVRVCWRGREATLGELLRFDREHAAELHARDRVHFYGSFHIIDLPEA